MRKSKLDKMQTSTGKVWETGDEQKPLNRLEKFYTNYSAASLDEYENQLKVMNALDLQKHATEVGEAPRDNRDLLISNLLKKFQEVK